MSELQKTIDQLEKEIKEHKMQLIAKKAMLNMLKKQAAIPMVEKPFFKKWLSAVETATKPFAELNSTAHLARTNPVEYKYQLLMQEGEKLLKRSSKLGSYNNPKAESVVNNLARVSLFLQELPETTDSHVMLDKLAEEITRLRHPDKPKATEVPNMDDLMKAFDSVVSQLSQQVDATVSKVEAESKKSE